MPRRSSSSGVDAVADHPAIAGDGRRLVKERGLELRPQLGEIVELRDEALDERSLRLRQQHANARHERDRLPQRDEIARTGNPERGARNEALDVVDRLQRLAQLCAFDRAKRELFDGVETILDPLERDQRTQQPRPQQAAAHRCHRAIDFVEQRPGPAAVGRIDDFERAQRRRIDDQAVGASAKCDLAHVREVGLLRVAQVVHERAGSAHGGRTIVESETDEALRLKLVEQRAPCRFLLEGPARHVRHARIPTHLRHERRRVLKSLGRDDLARLQDRQLVGESLTAGRPVILGSGEFSRRQIEERDADSFGGGVRRHRHEKRRLAGLEIAGIGQRTRGHDADDLAADESLRLARILHLLAHCDAESLLDEARDVAVSGVKGDAAHRDGATGRILRTRRQRELEGARRGEGVLVEHLVEVAHAEKDDGVSVLTLGIEVLPHRRGRPGRLGKDWGGHHSCAGWVVENLQGRV